MSKELLAILREIADSTKCKLPEGWGSTTHNGVTAVGFRQDLRWTIVFHDSIVQDMEHILGVLGRLMRAIEGEGKCRFWRGEQGWQQSYWSLENKDHGTSKKFYWVLGDVASEALALAKCVRAACAVEVAHV